MQIHRKGISLFEITIVMLVLGILAAVAAPRFSGSFQSSKLVAAANRIAGDLDYVRRVALNEGKTTTFHCDATSDRYWSGEVSFPQFPGQLLNVNIKAVDHPTFELKADFDGQASLSFDFEGVPHVGSTPLQNGSITLTSGSRTLVIQIAAGTGDTTVIQAPKEKIEAYQGVYEEMDGYVP